MPNVPSLVAPHLVGSMVLDEESLGAAERNSHKGDRNPSLVSPALPQGGFFNSVKACEKNAKFQKMGPKQFVAEQKANSDAVHELNKALEPCHHGQCCTQCWVDTDNTLANKASSNISRWHTQKNLESTMDLMWWQQFNALRNVVRAGWYSGDKAWELAASDEAKSVSKNNVRTAKVLASNVSQWLHLDNSSLAKCFQKIPNHQMSWGDCPASCETQGDIDCKDNAIDGQEKGTYADLSANDRQAFINKLNEEFDHTGSSADPVTAKKCARYQCSKAAEDTMTILQENTQKLRERVQKQDATAEHDREMKEKGVVRAIALAGASRSLAQLFSNRLMLDKEEAVRSKEGASATSPAPTSVAAPKPAEPRPSVIPPLRQLLSTVQDSPDWPFASRVYFQGGKSGLYCEDRAEGVQCDAAFSCIGGPPCKMTKDTFNPYNKHNNTLLFTIEPFRGQTKIAVRGGRLNKYCRDDWQSGKIVCDSHHVQQSEIFKFLTGDAYPGWVGLKGGGNHAQPWKFYCRDNTPHFMACTATKIEFHPSQMFRVINAEEEDPSACHQNKGHCVDAQGYVYNQAKYMWAAPGDWDAFDDIIARQQCLAWCQKQIGVTGCEFDMHANKCFVHTDEIETGNGASGAACWVFNKCGLVWSSSEKKTKNQILSKNIASENSAKVTYGKEQLHKTEKYVEYHSKESNAKLNCAHWKTVTHRPKVKLSKHDQVREKGFKEMQHKKVENGESVLREFSQKADETRRKKQKVVDEQQEKHLQKERFREHANKVTYVQASLISQRSQMIKERKHLIARNETATSTAEKACKACDIQQDRLNRLSKAMAKDDGLSNEKTHNFMKKYDEVKDASEKTCSMYRKMDNDRDNVYVAYRDIKRKIAKNSFEQKQVHDHNGCSWKKCSTKKCNCPGGFYATSLPVIDEEYIMCGCKCACKVQDLATLSEGMRWISNQKRTLGRGRCAVQVHEDLAQCSSKPSHEVKGCYNGNYVKVNCGCAGPGSWYMSLRFNPKSYRSCPALVPTREKRIPDSEAWYAACVLGEQFGKKLPCVKPVMKKLPPTTMQKHKAKMEAFQKELAAKPKISFDDYGKMMKEEHQKNNQLIERRQKEKLASPLSKLARSPPSEQTSLDRPGARSLLSQKPIIAQDNAANFELPDDEISVWHNQTGMLASSLGFKQIHREGWHHHDVTYLKSGREYDCPASFGYSVFACQQGRTVDVTCSISPFRRKTIRVGCGCNGIYTMGYMQGFMFVSEPGCSTHFHNWAYNSKKRVLDPTVMHKQGLTSCAVKIHAECERQHSATVHVSMARAKNMAMKQTREHHQKKQIFDEELSKFTSSISKTASVAKGLEQRLKPQSVKYQKIPGFSVRGVKVGTPTREGCASMCTAQESHCNAYNYQESVKTCALTPAIVEYDLDYFMYVKDAKDYFPLEGLKMMSQKLTTLTSITLFNCKKNCNSMIKCTSLSYAHKAKSCTLSHAPIRMSTSWDFYQKVGAKKRQPSEKEKAVRDWKEMNVKMDHEMATQRSPTKRDKDGVPDNYRHVDINSFKKKAANNVTPKEMKDNTVALEQSAAELTGGPDNTMVMLQSTESPPRNATRMCFEAVQELQAESNKLVSIMNRGFMNMVHMPDVPTLRLINPLINEMTHSKTTNYGNGVVRKQWSEVYATWKKVVQKEAAKDFDSDKLYKTDNTFGKPLSIDVSVAGSVVQTPEICIQQAGYIELAMHALSKMLDSHLHLESDEFYDDDDSSAAPGESHSMVSP